MRSGKNIIKQVRERELTDKELKRREEIAKDLPDADFKKRYGAAWKGIKMATATNMAKKEEVDLEEATMIADITNDNPKTRRAYTKSEFKKEVQKSGIKVKRISPSRKAFGGDWEVEFEGSERNLIAYADEHLGFEGSTFSDLKKHLADEVDLEETDIKMTDQVFDSGKQFKDFFKFMKSKFRLSLKGKVTPGENGDDFTLSGSDTNIIKYLRYLDDGGTLYLQMYKKKGNVYVGEEVDLEKKLNDNVEETLDKIREANVQKGRTMRSILADIWNVKEGKNPFEKVKKEDSSKKTLTGKKPTAVEIEPKIE